jgi:hypothetical protein
MQAIIKFASTVPSLKITLILSTSDYFYDPSPYSGTYKKGLSGKFGQMSVPIENLSVYLVDH